MKIRTTRSLTGCRIKKFLWFSHRTCPW